MITESAINSSIEALFANLEFTAQPAGLYDPLRYMIQIGGKRIRPRLCLMTYGLYRDEIGEGILDVAAALEVFHTFTLIHDDIMDKAPIRRGQSTVWKKWDANTAILSGDVMSIDSYRRMAKAPKDVLPQVLDLFSSTAAAVCEGQQYDMEFESVDKTEIGEYIGMIELKTACLIACAAKMGALVAGAPARDCDLLYEYGRNLGIAFQIEDDYLDTFGDVKTFGKSIGGDILNNKKTWLLTRAMQKDEQAMAAAIAMPSGTPELDAAKIEAVTRLYRDLEIDIDAKAEIDRYHGIAMTCAEAIGLSAVKTEVLSRFADKLVRRNK